MQGNGRRRFDGRVVVVTGGASGLGEAMAKAFAAEGGRVAVADIREEGAGKVAGAAGGEARGYACDVSDPEAVRKLFAAVASDLGDVEVLVNNAGIARRNQAAQDKMLEQFQAAATGAERESLGAT
jgi:NAD(P)-dependent dehydrogenase (short-subunit alcohol dehydrogenase family)